MTAYPRMAAYEEDDIARRFWPVRQWLSQHPRLMDWVVVLICTGIQRLAVYMSGYPSNWIALLFLAITALALLWRRTYPMMALLVIVTTSSAASVVLPHGYQSLPFAFALYAVASLQGFRRALLGYGVGVLIPILTVLAQSFQAQPAFSPAILDPLALIAFVLGIAVRAQRHRNEALVQLLNERTKRAKVTERARIAADMHDVVSHSLSTMIALANGAASAWSTHPERSAKALSNLSTVGRTALSDMNRILQLLPEDGAQDRHSTGEPDTSHQSLEHLVEIFRSADLPVRLTRRGRVLPEDPALHMTIYRIVQECLTNALRYAHGASKVEVAITTRPGAVEITVTDDSLQASQSIGAGRGLIGVDARAKTYNGTSEAGPRPGGGWRTQVVLHPEIAKDKIDD